MKLGFIKPNYSNEKRVALLPEDIINFENDIIVESGFGEELDYSDEDYLSKGCKVLTREEIFKTCDAIFSLKLIQPVDYQYLRNEQMIIGWTHPLGSGAEFMKKQSVPKGLIIVDLDNIYPTIYYKDKKIPIDWIPRNFVLRNSLNAGYAATMHALTAYGLIPSINTKVAILSPGNVSQGAYNLMAKLGADVRLFYRKTMNEFKNTIGDYDIIINGIEVDNPDQRIIGRHDLKNVKKGCLIIDAAADAGNAIEGTRFSSIDQPLYKENDIYYYVVNNAPSIFYRTASQEISKAFSKFVYKKDVARFYELAREIM